MMASKRLPSYPPVEGQLDVFDVIDLVEREGLVPDKPADKLPQAISREFMLKGIETVLDVRRDDDCSYWVVNPNGECMHELPFWSQIECWAFIVGWERSRYQK